jgi:hypothetical protein
VVVADPERSRWRRAGVTLRRDDAPTLPNPFERVMPMAAEEHRFLLLGPKRRFIPPVASAEDYRFVLGPKRRFIPPMEPAARVRAIA